MPGVGRIGKIAQTAREWQIAVDIAAQVGDRGVAEIRRIDTLRKQCKNAKKIQVLCVGVKAQGGLDFAAANAEPALEAVIGDRPVQGGVVLSELTKVAVVQLRSHPELIGDAGGHIEPEFGEGRAALTRVHRQPIICVGVDKSLRCESVQGYVAVKEFEVLRL